MNTTTQTGRSYADYERRSSTQWGDKWDAGGLDPRFVEYYNSGQRIAVESYGEIWTGTVGVTTGWRPTFLLMPTARSSGSCNCIGAKDRIVAVQHGYGYYDVNGELGKMKLVRNPSGSYGSWLISGV